MYEARFGRPVSSKFREGLSPAEVIFPIQPGFRSIIPGRSLRVSQIGARRLIAQRVDIVRIECMCRRELHRTSIIYENVDRVCTVAQGVHSGVDSLDSF